MTSIQPLVTWDISHPLMPSLPWPLPNAVIGRLGWRLRRCKRASHSGNCEEGSVATAKMSVPESILKKRKRDEEWAAARAGAAAALKEKRKASRKDVFKRAEAYAAEYRSQVC